MQHAYGSYFVVSLWYGMGHVYSNPSGLLCWPWGNYMIATEPMTQPWRIQVNKSHECTKTPYTNHNNMSTTKPCACIYIMCCNLPSWNHHLEVLSPLLAHSPMDSPHKGPEYRSLISVVVSLNRLFYTESSCQLFATHRPSDDVIAIVVQYPVFQVNHVHMFSHQTSRTMNHNLYN